MKTLFVIFLTLTLSAVFFMGDSVLATADDLKQINKCHLEINPELTGKENTSMETKQKTTNPDEVRFQSRKDCL